MKSREIADRYAEAVYDLGKEEGLLEELDRDLQLIKRIATEAPEFQFFIDHPLIPLAHKQELISEIFEDEVNPLTIRFLYLLLEKSRGDYLSLICQRFSRLKSDREDVVEVTVYTPRFFDEDKAEVEERIKKKLERIWGKKVGIQDVKQDSDLIGGIKLQIGDKVVDGSAQSRLNQMRKFVLEGDQGG